jgi:peptide/nickel transport system permease protein
MSNSSSPIPVPPEVLTEAETLEKEATMMVASQWKLMWWKLRRHKLAMVSGVIVILIYLIAIFVEFLQVQPQDQYNAKYTYAPPQALHLIDNVSGTIQVGLYVNGYKSEIDTFSLRRTFVVDPAYKIPLTFFAKGWEYKLLGFIPADIHLFGPVNKDDPVYLDDDRPIWCDRQPDPGHYVGRHLGLLWRGGR